MLRFCNEGAPTIEDVTFAMESYWKSFVDPASAQAPRAFACSIACGFSRPAKVRLRSRVALSPLRMTHRGYVVRTYEKNAVCGRLPLIRLVSLATFSSRRRLSIRRFQRLSFDLYFLEENISKIVPLKVRNLVSLPLEGKETAAGCRMRCRMRSIRLEKE